MRINEAKEQLLDIKKIFDSINTPFWLVGGTLLAAIRDKGFFDWDHDMDIGMFYKDYSPEFMVKFSPYFTTVKPISYGLGGTTGFDLRRTSSVRTNVFLYLHNPQKKVYYTCFPPYKYNNNVIPEDQFNFKEIDFIGNKFKVFARPEEMLTQWYGDWQTPVKKGVPWKDNWKDYDTDYKKGLIR